MLSDRIQKVNSWYEANKADLFTAAVIFLLGLGSFGLGRLSVLWPEKEPIVITDQEAGKIADPKPGTEDATHRPDPRGAYVASKSGRYYHLPDCPGAVQIKEQNKVWFATKEAAEQKGYRPATNCPGL